jgi:conjugal transfer/entry exclusion protein
MAMATGPTQAGSLVFDRKNYDLNKLNTLANEVNAIANEVNAASNLIRNGQLEEIRRQLSSKEEGTIINYTQINTDIDAHFTWIINKETGDEIIPIPRDVQTKVDGIRKGQTTTQYTSHYKSLDMIGETEATGRYADNDTVEASRARKAANDALVEAIAHDELALSSEAKALRELQDHTNDAKGHGNQLQAANALAGSQINQLMKLRSMMLVSEAARAAESQAAADREARAISVGKHLREGLSDVLRETRLVPAAY